MYSVIEIQTNSDGTVGVLSTSFADEYQAQSKYHTVLASAAVSELPMHTAYILTNDGYVIESKCFKHRINVAESEA